ncbi:MAG: spore protease YyaC [Lachnospiraceae bacterium]
MLTKTREIYYHKSDNSFSSEEFARQLSILTATHLKKGSHCQTLFLCIGSDRVTGDSLGPLIGYKLEKFHLPNSFVLGTLKNPVHAGNLHSVLEEIPLFYDEPLVIAIDASIGRRDHIGYITLGNHSIKPGLGVNKKLPDVGNISITGIVGSDSQSDAMILQNTRLSLVMSMADCICNGIIRFYCSDRM